MDRVQASAWVVAQAGRLGFDLCGIAAARPFEELAQLPVWLDRGHAGEMAYLRDPRRADPTRVLEGAQSIIVCGLNYNSPLPYSTQLPPGTVPSSGQDPRPRGWISRYAWGDDYHLILLEMLEALLHDLRQQIPEPFQARAYVDTGPVVERVAARHAGLGWLGKNTCLINENVGSWLFLGVIVTSLDLAPSLAPADVPPPDLCGNCRLCLDACPTQALVEPYLLDARRCISYLTIELRGAIPEELRPAVGRQVFGCDICQDVCPYNRDAPITRVQQFQPRVLEEKGEIRKSKFENRPANAPSPVATPEHPVDRVSNFEFQASSKEQKSLTEAISAQSAGRISNFEFRISSKEQESLFSPELEHLAALDKKEFQQVFAGSPIKRARFRGLVRNACVALGNCQPAAGDPAPPRILALLERLAASEDALIAEHARWALQRLRASSSP